MQQPRETTAAIPNKNALKSVVQNIVEEEERSRSFMVFGLQEAKDENLHVKVNELLLELDQKPKIEVRRIGSGPKKTTDKTVTRPVKVTVKSSTVVQEVLKRAKLLKDCAKYCKVFIAPDRSAVLGAQETCHRGKEGC